MRGVECAVEVTSDEDVALALLARVVSEVLKKLQGGVVCLWNKAIVNVCDGPIEFHPEK